MCGYAVKFLCGPAEKKGRFLMALVKTVRTVFKISSFVLRSTLGGAAVATIVAAVLLNRKRRKH